MSLWIATSAQGWGKGFTEDQAIEGLLPHLRHTPAKITTYKVNGYRSHGPAHVDADEILNEHDYTFTKDMLAELDGAHDAWTTAVDRVLANALQEYDA